MTDKCPTSNFICALIFALSLSSLNASAANTYETIKTRISNYSRLSERYITAAEMVGGNTMDRGQFANVDTKEHSCSVLAELLGVGQIYVSDTVQPDPGLDSQEPLALLLYGISLRNYVKVASELIDESAFTQRYKWNLNCHGLYESMKWFEVGKSEPFELSVADDGKSLKLIGDILPHMFKRVKSLLDAHPTIKSIHLASRGGAIGEAMNIGRLIRSKDLKTVVTNNCDSSCTLIMIGGVERIIAPPFYSMGFHRITQFDKVVSDDDPDYEAIRAYAADMIGTCNEFVAAWKSGTGSELYRPSLKTLCEMRVATTVQGICADE